MVDSDSAVRRLTRDAGKLLQPYGFHGSDTHWVHHAPEGVATIRRTRLQRTWTDGNQVITFGLELTATPRAWWEYCTWRATHHGLPTVPLEQATGPGLLLDPTPPWTVRVDPTRPGRHAHPADITTIRTTLPTRVHTYARRALRLLDPTHYAEELSTTPTPETWEVIAILLASTAPSPSFDTALHHFHTHLADHPDPTRARATLTYLDTHALT
ncbi:hypothetical protein ACFXK0_27465 [Nocardia sp. NPDC059177]|uniref:hypothetical protein n=1 Tax=Nocardia sp. NPDC059177 TaxID=3346759 RepID=UPI0036BAC745